MSETIERRSDIPDAPCYVLANDAFMSGWGRAEGMTNTVVLPCADYAEALRVAEYAESRSEMQRVRIVIHKPRLRRGVLYSLLTREDAGAWFR